MKVKLPLKTVSLKRWQDGGNLMQGYGENCKFYTPQFWKPNEPDPNNRGFKCHNGIDLYTHWGDEILAVCDGTIIDAGLAGARGYGVWQLSKPYMGADGKERVDMFCYFHMQPGLSVKTDDVVKEGQLIGLLGNTGDVISGNNPYWGNAPAHDGAHLHFGHYPLINGTDEMGNAYWIDGRPFRKEYGLNDENGAINPIPILIPDPPPIPPPIVPPVLEITDEDKKAVITLIDRIKLFIASLKEYFKGRNIA